MTTEPESSALTFPCEFVIKVFGNKNDEFEKSVLTIVKKHYPDLQENACTYRPSKDDKYIAMSILVYAENKAQLDATYQELSTNPNVLMVL
jgi:putative lipoic acid-binding regulatory protein